MSAMTTVLIVDDEPIVRDVVARYLKREGYETLEAGDGEAARALIESDAPNLVVLDVMLPGTDGLALCRWIRTKGDLPVIMLTARGEEADRIVGLELGADDYVTKPFSPRELVARVKAVLRRAAAPPPAEDVSQIGPVTVARAAREVHVDGRKVMLTQREFDLLDYLVTRAGQVVTRDELLESVWGFMSPGETRTVEVHIAQLRKKLGHPDLIETVRGLGYKAAQPA